MSQKVRERAGMNWYGSWLERYGFKPDFSTAAKSFDELVEYFSPTVIRSDIEALQDIHAHMAEAIKILEDGMSVDTNALMKEHGLDPANRSDSAKTRNFLKESGLLQYKGPQPEQWVRRITNGSGATTTPDTAE
jgi:hypothetical protein